MLEFVVKRKNLVYSKNIEQNEVFDNLPSPQQTKLSAASVLICQNTVKTEKQIIFESTSFGHLLRTLPIKELSKLLPVRKQASGAPSWVNAEGMISMLFLKSYTQLSDRKSIDHFNGNWQLQMFCGIQLSLTETIRDRNLMSHIRAHVSTYLNLDEFQRILLEKWRPYLNDTHAGMSEATVYESYMRIPQM